MYIPKAFRVDDKEKLIDFIKEHSFGILFSQKEDGPMAIHLPFLLDMNRGGNGALLSHMAKPNPQWKGLNNQEVLVVFFGPHAYISPKWYNEKNTVPTWNYTAVHVYGKFRVIEDEQQIKELLQKSVTFYENAMPDPWSFDPNEQVMEGLMKGIVGFEVEIERIEGKWKLSQNHPIERQQKVITGLKTVHSYDSQEIAELMEKNLNK